MDYEGALISKVLHEQSLSPVFDNRVQEELFIVHTSLWEYLNETYAKHGGLPPTEDVLKKFPDFELQEAEDYPATYLVEEMKKRHVHNLVTASMRKQADLLKAKDPFAALEEMRNAMIQADVDIRPSYDMNFVEDIDERVKLYEEAEVAGGITGIPTPWDYLNEKTQGFQSEDLIMIAGRGGIGKCIDAESLIVDPKTGVERTIRDVVEGDQETIFSWDKTQGIREEVISNKIDTGRKKCLKYVLESGREIIVTPEHPFLTPQGWLRADLLDAGDYVGLPSQIPFPQDPSEEFDRTTTEFLALLLSEGSYTGHHVGFSSEDPQLIYIAKKFVENTPAEVVHRSGVDYDISVGNVGGHTPNPARELLRSLGIDGKRAVDKTIPDIVYQFGPKRLAQFLSVFWMADGYVESSGPGITLSSKRMVEQLQHLLLRFGIQSSVNYKPVKGGFSSWRLRIYSHCSQRFSEVVSLWGDKKVALEDYLHRRSLVKSNPNVGGPRWRVPKGFDWDKPGVHWDRISDVQDVGERKIYDLTIQTTSCFVANDIIVHNTWSELVCAWKNWSDGYIPLVFSREMAVWQMARRLDAINAKLPYHRFKSGMLTSEELERWKKALELMKGSRPMWITGDDGGGHLGVTAISNKINQYQPHIVYIDGAYLIKDDLKAKDKWERFYNVCEQLKRLAQLKKMPIVVTHQFGAAGKGMEGTEDTLKFGDVQMWFDLIIGCYRSEDMIENKEMLFKILKSREGGNVQWVSDWDFDKMSFDQKPGEDDLREGDQSYEKEEPVKF